MLNLQQTYLLFNTFTVLSKYASEVLMHHCQINSLASTRIRGFSEKKNA